MVRLGLQLTLRGGREALVRTLMIAAAVAIGVTVLLAVLADYHAYQGTSRRAGNDPGGARAAPVFELRALEIQREHLPGPVHRGARRAALGARRRWCRVDQASRSGPLYASPALAKLIKSVPADELGDRFPGTEVGTIGLKPVGPERAGGHRGVPAGQARHCPAPSPSTRSPPLPDIEGTTGMYREAFWVGASWSCSHC